MYLIDTNIVSEARRRSPQAVNWLRSVDPNAVHLGVVTIGEIMRGIALKAKRDPRGGSNLSAWLQTLRQDYSTRILPVTEHVALEWGRLAALRPPGDVDGLIAATAIVHDLIIVTRNIADFEDTRASIVNPWDGPEA
jgi:predicted nucleic acid-binding protein